ncbi:hypothetical protein [Psychroserpens sp. S379A]|uniref:hypothetical protein n=1 Tax=Psychroserpens sp. S379A TaxID=3415137 RepID=UPI003C7E9022
MKNFTIYRLAIFNNAKEEQILNRFNGTSNLLEVCFKHLRDLKENRVDYFDSNGNKRTYAVSSEIDYQEENGIINTYLDSAYTGENFEIRNGESNKLTYSVQKDDLQNRKMFTFINIPKNSKYGYVVFENKSKHGLKVIFERRLQLFLKESGFKNYRIVMSPGLNFNYLSNMIEKGKLKKVRLIKYRLSKDVQLSLWDNIDINSNDQDIRELKFKSKTNNTSFKKELYSLFFSRVNKDEKIYFMDEFEVDEISFEINYNGSSKTFFIREKSKMRSNIDVSNRLKFIDGEATNDSLIKVSIELINEILGFDSSDFDEVA